MGRYQNQLRQKYRAFSVIFGIIGLKFAQFQSSIHPQQYAEIRSLLALLIFIVLLIITYHLCANISRLKWAAIDYKRDTESYYGIQAKKRPSLWQFRAFDSDPVSPLKTSAIGLISKYRSISASIFFTAKFIVKSIYYPFLALGQLFSLRLLASIATLPNFRSEMMAWIQPYVASPQSVLVNGMVFGDDTGMPESVSHSVKVIGMQHVMAASGFNVGLVLNLCRMFLRKITPPTVTALISLLAIGGYVALIGAPASAVRAGLMVSYAIVAASFFRRQFVAWYGLVFCAVSMLLLSSEYWDSISFQLSVSATLGIILIEPRLSQSGGQTWFGSLDGAGKDQPAQWPKISSIFKETAITTIAAQAFTLPLLLFHFGELSSLSLIANVALLWMTPLITVAGIWLVILTGVVQVVPGLSLLATLGGLALNGLASLFLYLVSWLGQFNSTLLILPFKYPLWAVFLWWLILSLWLYFGKTRVKAA